MWGLHPSNASFKRAEFCPQVEKFAQLVPRHLESCIFTSGINFNATMVFSLCVVGAFKL